MQSYTQITIDLEPPSPGERSPNRPTQLIIPKLVVKEASPVKEQRLPVQFHGSPPPHRQSVGETNFFAPRRTITNSWENPGSLDLPFIPPTITITANANDSESDANHSHLSIPSVDHSLLVPTASGMCYLRPLSIYNRDDRTVSESNLSSSGYSSMASPGPSRCGSSNPLGAGDMEDPGGSSSSRSHLLLYHLRRPNNAPNRCQQHEGIANGSNDGPEPRQRLRSAGSDSETLSDDVLLESNDEGIGTDNLDEKCDEGECRSAKKLEMNVIKEHIECDSSAVTITNRLELPSVNAVAASVGMSQLQLPSIVLQPEGHSDKGVSPVSSRSESPIR